MLISPWWWASVYITSTMSYHLGCGLHLKLKIHLKHFFPKMVSSCSSIRFSEQFVLMCYFELVIISGLFWAHFCKVRGSYDGLSIFIHVGVANTLLYNTSHIHSILICLNSGLFSVCKVMALFQCITYPQNQPEMFFS